MRSEFYGTLLIPVDKIIHLRSVIDEVFDEKLYEFQCASYIDGQKYRNEINCIFDGEDGVECNLLFELFLSRTQDLVGEGFHYDLENTVRWVQ